MKEIEESKTLNDVKRKKALKDFKKTFKLTKKDDVKIIDGFVGYHFIYDNKFYKSIEYVKIDFNKHFTKKEPKPKNAKDLSVAVTELEELEKTENINLKQFIDAMITFIKVSKKFKYTFNKYLKDLEEASNVLDSVNSFTIEYKYMVSEVVDKDVLTLKDFDKPRVKVMLKKFDKSFSNFKLKNTEGVGILFPISLISNVVEINNKLVLIDQKCLLPKINIPLLNESLFYDGTTLTLLTPMFNNRVDRKILDILQNTQLFQGREVQIAKKDNDAILSIFNI